MSAVRKSIEPVYDNAGRMKYHPEYHPNHGKDWMLSDEKYLIDNYDVVGKVQCSYALGRTESTISERVRMLREQGKMPKFYKGMKKYHRGQKV